MPHGSMTAGARPAPLNFAQKPTKVKGGEMRTVRTKPGRRSGVTSAMSAALVICLGVVLTRVECGPARVADNVKADAALSVNTGSVQIATTVSLACPVR